MSRPSPPERRKTRLPRVALVAATMALGACAYFNAMYNAQRSFADAERAMARGEPATAQRAWLDAIERAASSYRDHPDSRWADDALLIIARSWFRLEDYEAARAAALAALDASEDAQAAAEARVLAGAAEFMLGDVASATARLDAAIGAPDSPPAEAYLWRARARFAAADARAWEDLDRAAAGKEQVAGEAALEGAARALAAGDPERFASSVQMLVATRSAAGHADSLALLIGTAAGTFRGTGDIAAGIDESPWPGTAREPVQLARARFLAAGGDTTAAIAAALRVASRASTANAAAARVLAARLELAGATSVDAMDRARTILLPALTDNQARGMLRNLRVVEVLLERAGRAGQPLALFAAAEVARDDLNAPGLAREFFLAYADLVPDAVWAPKALLAAAALGPAAGPGEDFAERFAGQADNVYVRAVFHDDAPEAFASAEERLAQSLRAIRFDAYREADQRDLRVGSAIARLDSLKEQVRADSLRLLCGMMLDSLAIRGVRADSVRSACLRGDTAALGTFMRIDTLLLRDTTRDTMQARLRRGAVRDTFFSPFL